MLSFIRVPLAKVSLHSNTTVTKIIYERGNGLTQMKGGLYQQGTRMFLANHLSTFSLCPKNLNVAMFRNNSHVIWRKKLQENTASQQCVTCLVGTIQIFIVNWQQKNQSKKVLENCKGWIVEKERKRPQITTDFFTLFKCSLDTG